MSMEITPDQLRYLREQRRMTREELAAELKCSASAIVQWEGGKREIPSWVADRMFAKLPVNFTVQELSEMYDLCREESMTIGELIQEAVRMRLEERRTAAADKTLRGQNIYQLPQNPQSIAAEDSGKYGHKDGTND